MPPSLLSCCFGVTQLGLAVRTQGLPSLYVRLEPPTFVPWFCGPRESCSALLSQSHTLKVASYVCGNCRNAVNFESS